MLNDVKEKFNLCTMKLRALILLIAYLISAVHAYGYLGHYVIGEVTYRTLSDQSLAYMRECGYLDAFNGSLGLASVWADVLKRNPKYRWTSVLHYYDIDNDPPSYCGIFEPPKSNRSLNLYNEVGRALRNATSCEPNHVSGHRSSEFARQVPARVGTPQTTCCASKFHSSMLWHLLQDFYQPLHLTGKARGGNEIWFVKNGKRYNLHRFWDSGVLDLLMKDVLGYNYTDTQAVNYFYEKMSTVKLPEDACNGEDVVSINGYIFSKAQKILDSNCQLIWDTTKEDYISLSKDMMERLILSSVVTLNCVITLLSFLSFV